ncbi:MAG: MerR family transcriptional regulator [Lewinellaceae bacterium]|nr:MerR family transcriptional regulator [Lewinellaceae bacterium]
MQSFELTKLYYSIGEVADMFSVAPSMIRYWESEFKQLKPGKNSKGERKYTSKDIRILSHIFHLVKEKGFTIDGAKKELEFEKKTNKEQEALIKKLNDMKEQLIKLRKFISEH